MHSLLRYTILVYALLALHVKANCQEARKSLAAKQIAAQVVLDGRLDEPAWQEADQGRDFVQSTPLPGEKAWQKTEVRILYDNDAIYVGAIIYDIADSVLKQLSPRDNFEDYSVDAFGVIFDTYFDQQNATEFAVTASGVQIDAILKFGSRNLSWNAAWLSKVAHTDSGWCVEMKIPYSALRFSKKKEQLWGVNFYRVIRRLRERSHWSTVLPTIPNSLSQEGILTGIHDIKPPLRLALLPYVSAYAENYEGANAQTLNGGLDVKYGLTESFTLDMTLVPDFGQTIYDNRVLNLSPIEVRYNENRYFFTEGLDLFNKNDLFYSRRVGGAPVNFNAASNSLLTNETITRNPATTKLFNATKVSGRTKGNLGIGFFNAIAAPAYATIEDTVRQTIRKLQTAPLTNYNVVVLDQALKNNSYISFINTNVNRMENSYNANVSALLFKFTNKANSYGVSGSGDASQLFYTAKNDVGHRYYLNAGKLNGNYTWTVSTRSISDNFNPNDLGYLDRNNITSYAFDQYYNLYEPVGRIRMSYNHVGINYNRIFNPDAFYKTEVFGSHNITLMDFTTIGAYWTLQPITSYDYLEPRKPGRYYTYPINYMGGGFYSSDYRKRFALDVQVTNRWFSERARNTFSWSVSPRFRFNDRLSAIYSLSGLKGIDDVGFVANRNDSIFFGIRNVNTVTNSLYAAYVFNNKMSLTLLGRHYWSQVQYSRYAYLRGDGGLDITPTYAENRNVNFNTFNIFLSYVWQFRPGSEMSIVYQNSIFSSPSSPRIINNYFDDLDHTFQAPQSNSLSVKIIYYLDYLQLQRAVNGRG